MPHRTLQNYKIFSIHAEMCITDTTTTTTKYGNVHSKQLALLTTCVLFSTNTSLYQTKCHHFPNPANVTSVNFAATTLTSILKQSVPHYLQCSFELDYCSYPHNDLPKSQVNPLQQIQNCLAQAVLKTPLTFYHTTPNHQFIHQLKTNNAPTSQLIYPQYLTC